MLFVVTHTKIAYIASYSVYNKKSRGGWTCFNTKVTLLDLISCYYDYYIRVMFSQRRSCVFDYRSDRKS